jgi:hypothetical protein
MSITKNDINDKHGMGSTSDSSLIYVFLGINNRFIRGIEEKVFGF